MLGLTTLSVFIQHGVPMETNQCLVLKWYQANINDHSCLKMFLAADGPLSHTIVTKRFSVLALATELQ